MTRSAAPGDGDTGATGDGAAGDATRPAAAAPLDAFAASWLALREPADAVARALPLLDPLVAALPAHRPLAVHDLGSGTGSMARWLAARLPGPQRWVLHDHDPALLAAARTGTADLLDADGAPVAVETRHTDLTRLRPADLAGADLVTASALLDLLTETELDALAAACAAAGRPVLLTLSVAGHVELDPPQGADHAIAAGFDDHQRRTVAGRRLLGPDAPDAAVAAFTRHGMAVRTAASPWRLGPHRSALRREWLSGWVGAAVEQVPELRDTAGPYLRQRQDTEFTAVVAHRDLLALPVVAP